MREGDRNGVSVGGNKKWRQNDMAKTKAKANANRVKSSQAKSSRVKSFHSFHAMERIQHPTSTIHQSTSQVPMLFVLCYMYLYYTAIMYSV